MRVIEDSATELDVFKDPSTVDALPAVTDTTTADAEALSADAPELPAVAEALSADAPELPADVAHGGDR